MAVWQHNGLAWERVPLADSFASKTAVIIGAGPSLASVDIESLRTPDYVLIAMNSAYPHVKPDFWVGMDDAGCHSSGLWDESFPKIMRGSYGDMEYGGRLLRDRRNVWFVDVAEKPKGDELVWYNDTFRTAIQFGLFLGCTKFLFAGIDLDNSRLDYVSGNCLTAVQKKGNQRLYDQQFAWLREFSREKPCATMTQNRLARIMPVHGEQTQPLSNGRPHVTSGTSACNEVKALKSRGGKPYSIGHQKMYLTAIEAITGNGSCSVLDVGCGIGFGVESLIKKGHSGRIVAIEPEPDCIRHVSEKLAETQADVTLIEGGFLDATCVELAPADYVFCIEVIEHIAPEKINTFLQKLREMTIKNLFFSTPDSSKSSHGVATEAEWKSLLENAGFSAVAINQQWTTLYICE